MQHLFKTGFIGRENAVFVDYFLGSFEVFLLFLADNLELYFKERYIV
jgi:hypothetical protein